VLTIVLSARANRKYASQLRGVFRLADKPEDYGFLCISMSTPRGDRNRIFRFRIAPFQARIKEGKSLIDDF
jgi:hypothetical protein